MICILTCLQSSNISVEISFFFLCLELRVILDNIKHVLVLLHRDKSLVTLRLGLQ